MLGLDEVPCIVLAHLTPTQRRAYVLADNKLALNAGWDLEMLSAAMAAIWASVWVRAAYGISRSAGRCLSRKRVVKVVRKNLIVIQSIAAHGMDDLGRKTETAIRVRRYRHAGQAARSARRCQPDNDPGQLYRVARA